MCQNIIDYHKKLRRDGRQNYVGLQIPVQSKLNDSIWARYLGSLMILGLAVAYADQIWVSHRF